MATIDKRLAVLYLGCCQKYMSTLQSEFSSFVLILLLIPKLMSSKGILATKVHTEFVRHSSSHTTKI